MQYLKSQKLYVQRARVVFPILVRQAQIGQTLFYSELANEVGMPNPRNLNYVLGAIGDAINTISDDWDEEIPPIQCLVINKSKGLPGEGFLGFLSDTRGYLNANKSKRKSIIREVLSEVFMYENWEEVLSELSLEPITWITEQTEEIVNRLRGKRYGSGGEGEEHKAFKEKIYENPSLIDIKGQLIGKELEYEFLSKDRIDILFKGKKEWIGVEVKSRISDSEDILRGLFQVIKYEALIKAEQIITGIEPEFRCVLALESTLPRELVSIVNQLGVEVYEEI